jgi:hypothetical protein
MAEEMAIALTRISAQKGDVEANTIDDKLCFPIHTEIPNTRTG